MCYIQLRVQVETIEVCKWQMFTIYVRGHGPWMRINKSRGTSFRPDDLFGRRFVAPGVNRSIQFSSFFVNSHACPLYCGFFHALLDAGRSESQGFPHTSGFAICDEVMRFFAPPCLSHLCPEATPVPCLRMMPRAIQ